MDKKLHGLIGILVYFDEILIAGMSLEECYDRVCSVLGRLHENSIQVNFRFKFLPKKSHIFRS